MNIAVPAEHGTIMKENEKFCLFVGLFGFYGISLFVGYLMPNLFLYK